MKNSYNEYLSKIVDSTKKRLAMAQPPSFFNALQQDGISFICEVKRASPSKGLIFNGDTFPYLDIAKDYEKAGAAAISVLTEPEYFLGLDKYLENISHTVNIPTLCKDFIIDPFQIYKAKHLGASAVLLICAILTKQELQSYINLTDKLGLDALVETHTEEEIKLALSCNAKIIGVNNRSLSTFEVDIQNAVKLRKLVPSHILFVAESGIKTREDIKTLENAGVDAVLIGETMMLADDKITELRRLRYD